MPKTFPCTDYCPKQCAAMHGDQPCLFSGYCKARDNAPPIVLDTPLVQECDSGQEQPS